MRGALSRDHTSCHRNQYQGRSRSCVDSRRQGGNSKQERPQQSSKTGRQHSPGQQSNDAEGDTTPKDHSRDV